MPQSFPLAARRGLPVPGPVDVAVCVWELLRLAGRPAKPVVGLHGLLQLHMPNATHRGFRRSC